MEVLTAPPLILPLLGVTRTVTVFPDATFGTVDKSKVSLRLEVFEVVCTTVPFTCH